MSTHVLDASVAAAAFLQEEHADRARRLWIGNGALYAPDLIYAEFANVIWKRYRRGEIGGDEPADLLKDFRRLPLKITPCSELVDAALELALSTGRSAYDCIYLALAVKTGAAMVSADKRLVNALGGTELARHVVWIGDV